MCIASMNGLQSVHIANIPLLLVPVFFMKKSNSERSIITKHSGAFTVLGMCFTMSGSISLNMSSEFAENVASIFTVTPVFIN